MLPVCRLPAARRLAAASLLRLPLPFPSAASAAAARPFHASPPPGQAKKKGAPAAAAGPAVVESYDLKTQIPVNLMKEGGEPVYRPDAEYPPWVWQLLEEPPLPEDLLMMGVEHMSAKEMKYVKRAANKDRLATNNENSEKTKASMD